MRKQKDAKIGSPQWVAAWKRMFEDGFVMRCIIEQDLDSLLFWMESFLACGDIIYRIRFERHLGQTIVPPKVYLEVYGCVVETLLSDLEHFWIAEGMHNYLTIRELKLAVPHRGFIRPLDSESVFLLETNHPLLMEDYGAVCEWVYQARKGRVKADNNNGMVEDDERMLWQTFGQRFKAFLYQQKLALLKSTIGKVVSTTENETF